jgi:hypothetical protein
MADEPSRSIWESLRLWLTAVGIPSVLAVAGFWQFYLKEVLWPAAAINLTTEVTIKEAGISTNPKAKNLEAIQVVITAQNPSSSTIYLCTNYWLAYGLTIGAPKQEKGEDWAEDLSRVINSKSGQLSGKHYIYNERILVAGGWALGDYGLNPHEKVSATYVFYIPQGRYDLLAVEVMVPTTARGSTILGSALKINYKWDANASTYTPASFARVNPDGTQTEIPLDANSLGFWGLPEGETRYHGLQGQGSRAHLSLWQTDKPRTTTENSEGTP